MAADNPEYLLANVEEIVSGHPNVAVIVLTREDFGPVNTWARKLGDSLYALSDRDGLVQTQILVVNRSLRWDAL
jgi:hypothetical protein